MLIIPFSAAPAKYVAERMGSQPFTFRTILLFLLLMNFYCEKPTLFFYFTMASYRAVQVSHFVQKVLG